MPQGWRPTHPGDPTPKWGLSKAGRLVIATTVAVGVVIAVMIIATRPAGASESLASPAMSQEPSPAAPPWFGGQRVEMPEYGLAVTVPDDWVAFDTRVDIFSQFEAAAGRIDPDVWSLEDELHFAGLWEKGFILHLRDARSVNGCSVDLRLGDSMMPLHERAEIYARAYAGQPAASDYRDVEPPLRIGLPAGPAYLIRLSLDPAADVDVWHADSVYLLGGQDAVAGVHCGAAGTRTDDLWLAIAESIEFLPVGVQASTRW